MVVNHHLQMSEDEKAKYEEAFKIIDKDGNGKVNSQELEKVMSSLGQSLTEAEVKEMIKQVDKNGSGTVELAEYRALIYKRLKDKEAEAELDEAFMVFDKDGSGHISADEIRQGMSKLQKAKEDDGRQKRRLRKGR
ncbi:unnamed protein product, partial [Cuscuta europaea]